MTDLYPSRRAPEPGVFPRRDAVVHSTWTPDAPLSRDQAEQFDQQGYLVLDDVFGTQEMATLQAETVRLLGDPSGLQRDTMITEPGGEEVRSIFAIHAQSQLIGRLASDDRLADVARFLLGDDVYIHQSRLNYKPGFQGKEFYWHSDFETWHVEDGMPRMRALSMSILLAENTPHNGPLMLMPGSHRTFVSCVGGTPDDHYKMSLKKQEYGVPDEDSLARLAHRHGIVSPIGKPGTVIIFDCNMMHGSNGNITPFPRANAFIVYNAVSNRLQAPFGAKTPRPEFVASRRVDPLFPVSDDLAAYAA
ncbi:ectoine hydroxylase [Sphingosinicella sp.]|uniref:ectoine hydroxylase n=1 Tax=Sphingosinicella sp. TaxID=1917971 RepID=UPI00181E2A46|nr:ectoine hydroxylase [Sphingosinicella sp.]MBA4758284.1 ectoine hydroxylase [Sphingosinicella sp.]